MKDSLEYLNKAKLDDEEEINFDKSNIDNENSKSNIKGKSEEKIETMISSPPLKENNKEIKAVAVEPYDSQVLAGKSAGAHKIQGIGANFKPKNFNADLIDEIIPVTNEDAIAIARDLGTKEGILAGFSGGANVFAAIELAKRPENNGKTVVAILPDFGERYLSSILYN